MAPLVPVARSEAIPRVARRRSLPLFSCCSACPVDPLLDCALRQPHSHGDQGHLTWVTTCPASALSGLNPEVTFLRHLPRPSKAVLGVPFVPMASNSTCPEVCHFSNTAAPVVSPLRSGTGSAVPTYLQPASGIGMALWILSVRVH